MMTKAIRASISIAGIDIEVFQLPSGGYVMSQTQSSKAVGKSGVLMLRFLTQSNPEALTGSSYWDYTVDIEKDWTGRGGSQSIKIVPIELATGFWLEQALKGNEKAKALVAACMQEALQRRCDNVFGITKTEQQYEQQSFESRESWESLRQYLKEQHTVFVLACDKYRFSRASTHDKLTLAAVGKTAKELKEMEVIGGDKDIGLNHIQNSDELMLVASMKKHFSRYRKGSLEERIARALKEARKERSAK